MFSATELGMKLGVLGLEKQKERCGLLLRLLLP